MRFHELKTLLKQLLKENSCQQCNSKYTEDDVTILGSLKDEVIMHVTCSKCQANVLVNASLSRKHRKLDVQNTPVSSNEVIEVHQFLQTFDGDFKKLFSE